MLSAKEYFNIAEIERLRKLHGREIDANDNYSLHIALFDGEKLLGVTRLYKHNDGVMLELPLLYKYDAAHEEMLFKALMLKASNMNINNIYAQKGNRFIKEYTEQNGIIKTDIKHINDILYGGCHERH